jgi:hypothetical protein
MERTESDVIDDEELGRGVAQHAAVVALVAAARAELREHLRGRREKDRVSTADGAVPECLRDVRLPDAARSEEQHVFEPVDEASRRELDEPRLRHLRIEREVEVLETLSVLERGAAESEAELLCLPSFDFVVEQSVEEVGGTEVVGRHLLEPGARRPAARRDCAPLRPALCPSGSSR